MKKLNLRNPKTFDYTKEAGAIPPRIRFYCVSEGATEESYFLVFEITGKNCILRMMFI